MTVDPHAGAALARAGAAPEAATLGLVCVHGRGGSAADILGLADLAGRADIAAVAPEARGNSWWPTSFLEPMAALEPWLTSALAAVDRAVAALEAHGLPRARIALAGFSQGACLALEYAARSGGPWRAVIGLSGGLVGTADAPGGPAADLYGRAPKVFAYPARLDGVPVWLGCHEADPHIPARRVRETVAQLSGMGAQVEMALHPGAGHGVTRADAEAVRRLLAG
jgi:phospholipase/carboxylesterase